MFRNYLSAALHNLIRNKLYAGLNIVGLAVGFAAAILIALFIRDEYGFDRFVADGERVFLVPSVFHEVAGQKKYVDFAIAFNPIPFLKKEFPQIEAAGRLFPETGGFRTQRIEANEYFFWADPDLFKVLQLPAVAGNAQRALERPDAAVVTRAMARKYFGRDAPLGEVLWLDRRHPVRIAAVIEDYPHNTHLSARIVLSGQALFSRMRSRDAGIWDSSSEDAFYTYVKLRPGADARALREALPAAVRKSFKAPQGFPTQWLDLDLVPLAQVHLYPAFDGMHRLQHSVGGSRALIQALALIGVLIVLAAGINFVNLMTARAARRSIEVGVRKAVGAGRCELVVQFIGESLIYAVLALLLGMVLVEWLLAAFNALLSRNILFDYWRDPRLAGGMIGGALLAGVLAGAYPAFVLSSFRPVVALKGGVSTTGAGRVRQLLVIAQFAVLIALLIGVAVVYRQTMFALSEGVRLETQRVLLVRTACRTPFRHRVRQVPGVLAAACAHGMAVHSGWLTAVYLHERAGAVQMFRASVDSGFFELYGLKPLAGRLFASGRGGAPAPNGAPAIEEVVLNESAVRRADFASASAAVGQTLKESGTNRPYVIVGVVPDYSLDVLHEPVRAMVYRIDPDWFEWLSIKLTGVDLPQTLAAIDRLWTETGDPRPIERKFFDQHLRWQAADVASQGRILAVFAGVAIVIACLGLFGLSVFTAERRIREIGIRKALGAGRGDIVRLLLWQFIRPVLWANLLAWPAAYVAMSRWLDGFLAHVELEPSMFLAASACSMVIAPLTVFAHAYAAAGRKPVVALRHE